MSSHTKSIQQELYFSWFLKHATTKTRGDHFRFGSVFIKKSNQTEFKKKKPKPNRNRVKPVWLGCFCLARFSRFWLSFFRFWLGFFRFWLGFFRCGSVISVWLGFDSVWLGFGLVFFQFFSVSVQFGFFSFFLIKPKPNRTGRFFQNFNRFFFRFGCFGYFFLGLIGFLVFLLTPNKNWIFCCVIKRSPSNFLNKTQLK